MQETAGRLLRVPILLRFAFLNQSYLAGVHGDSVFSLQTDRTNYFFVTRMR